MGEINSRRRGGTKARMQRLCGPVAGGEGGGGKGQAGIFGEGEVELERLREEAAVASGKRMSSSVLHGIPSH